MVAKEEAPDNAGGFLVPAELAPDLVLMGHGWVPPEYEPERWGLAGWPNWLASKVPPLWRWLRWYMPFLFRSFDRRVRASQVRRLENNRRSRQEFLAAHPELTRGPA